VGHWRSLRPRDARTTLGCGRHALDFLA
jgi:hypothetical protein